MQELVSKQAKNTDKGVWKQGAMRMFALETREVTGNPGNEFHNVYPST
jgi:hypothetical protein